ncbi:restriction endonuclease [Neobacillus drentensis]|uniref:restriction endonuclease n=1 Tax=Neobacillus drentensis TaxID=220684 RepID=UPI002FFE420D
MAYYWKCKKHNEVMKEKLDESGTKIIPYCSHCECKKEYEEALVDTSKRFKYKSILPKHKTLNVRIGYQLSIVLCMVLLFNILIAVIIEKEISAIIGCSFAIFLLLSISIHDMFFSKLAKQKVLDKLLPTLEQIKEINIEKFRMYQREVNEYKERLKRQFMYNNIDFKEIDSLDGFKFEEYIAKLLENLGFSKTYVTKKSGDFGADIIAIDKNDTRVAVQCKRYGTQNSVGNDAIQQIYSAMGYFDCQKAMVITTSYFSKPALQMAQKLGVELWNRNTLTEKIASITKESWNEYLSKYYVYPHNPIPLSNDKFNYVKYESVER